MKKARPSERKDLPSEETRTLYGLRSKATGAMLRVETEVERYGVEDGENVGITYALTYDESCPVFDAGSEEGLSLVFSRRGGDDAAAPAPGGLRKEDVEPVVIVERVSRSTTVPRIDFQIPVELDVKYAIDVGRKMQGTVDGLAAVIDAVEGAASDLRDVRHRGGEWPMGAFHLVGYVVPVAAADLPEGLVGSLVRSKGNGDFLRRGLATLPLPAEWTRLAGDGAIDGALVVCLGDARRLPGNLLEELRSIGSTAPAP